MTVDYLEQFGKRLASWDGEIMGNRRTAFFIYENNGTYTGIGYIAMNYYSQPFDHLPSPQEVESHFQKDERFKKHFQD